jgi:hypothetical protein
MSAALRNELMSRAAVGIDHSTAMATTAVTTTGFTRRGSAGARRISSGFSATRTGEADISASPVAACS